MGCVQQAVLEFDEEVRAPWRPRLVQGGADTTGVHPLRLNPNRRSPSRVGVCRPPESPAAPPRRAASPRRPAPGAVTTRPRQSAPSARPATGVRQSAVRLRLTRRARRLAVVLALATGVALGSWLGPLLGGGGGLELAGGSSVVVQPGDTLWSIAGELGGSGDVRALIDEIQQLNGLSGSEVIPGQILQLP
jgi:hypothetical protein